ncbi:hypothetical protein P43SY_003055 [Pythium insidiosum]|uniref:Uncharacterized protein n=1 Tax=Pythium insidiosum TaxID=114742 RepID=A0AAD5M4H0_PYTIN|nr:hypothetical protein P43SY_003055 [Pythium insidiosum]
MEPTPASTTTTTPPDADEMQRMWQFLDSTLSSGSTPNGVPPHQPVNNFQQQQQQQQQRAPHQQHHHAQPLMPEAATAEPGDSPPLNEIENGMYNELGDVFNMFFTLDSDDHSQHAAVSQASAQAQAHLAAAAAAAAAAAGTGSSNTSPNDVNAKVQLPRNASAGSAFSDGISPGTMLGYPSMSPATMNWLQSLAKSASSDSLSGLVSPAALSFSGSAGGLSVIEGSSSAGGGSSTQGGLPRSPSCEMIDWKAYNDACGTAEKTQKEPPKWRVIPQHGPHADPTSAANATATYANAQSASRPPAGAAPNNQGMAQSDGGLRTHFTRQLQTIKSTVVSLVGALGATDAATGQETAATSHPRTQIDPAEQSVQPMPLQHPHQHQSHLDPAHIVLPPEVLLHHQQQQAAYGISAQRLAEEKNKRKAIISPEYVQYGTGVSHGATSSSMPPPGAPGPATYGNMPAPVGGESIKYEVVNGQIVGQVQYATQVPDPRGRHHRNEHCEDCNHCYFAGVANSFSCSCKSGKNGTGSSSYSASAAGKASGVGDPSSPPTSERSKGDDPTDDENSNPQVKGDIAAGLSNTEQEKDDACPVQ